MFCLFLAFAVAGWPIVAAADAGFLERVDETMELCSVVEGALRSSYRADTAERLKVLEDEMRPSFTALPKTRFGFLGSSATRYLLHRHFLRARAWLVNGLAPTGLAWSGLASPIAMLDNQTAEMQTVRQRLEQRLNTRGLDLSEVAMMAAMIENQVHQDTVSRLRKAWHAQGMPSIGSIGLADADLVLDTYMMSYIIHSEKALEPTRVANALRNVHKAYPTWNFTQAFVRETLRRSRPIAREEFSFTEVEHVVVEISENYGLFQSGECTDLKKDLLAIEGRRPGRVDLRDFFDQAVNHNNKQFGESVAYMRRVGILDETDADMPSIMVSNYIDSPAQYVASSDSYAVTCIDECEGILHEIERRIAAPYAEMERLVAVVASIESDTQPSREAGLPPRLFQLLEEMSTLHAGARRVALHGRLFAQFLHHAFPLECPYPHVSAADMRPMLPEEFCELFGEGTAYASHEEMVKYATLPRPQPSPSSNTSACDDLPWDATEELVAPWSASPTMLLSWPLGVPQLLRLACCLALVVMMLPQLLAPAGTWLPAMLGSGFLPKTVTADEKLLV